MNLGTTMFMKTPPIAVNSSPPPQSSIPAAPSGINRLYLLGGQSNMDGYAGIAGLPPEMQGIFNPRAFVYVVNGGILANIEAGVYNGTINNETNRFGPLIPFAYYEGLKHPNDNLFFAIYAQSNTNISVDWAPPSGYSYINCIGNYDLILEELAIVGLSITNYECFAYYQGESEADTLVEANSYYDLEYNLFTAVLANTAFTKIIDVKISTNKLYNSIVNTAKANNALRLNMRLVDSAIANPDFGLHLTPPEVVVLGQMMSDELTGF